MRRFFRFSMRDLLWLTLVVLVAAGLWWWLHVPATGLWSWLHYRPATQQSQVYFAETPAYRTKVASFRYSPEDARIIAEKHLKDMQPQPQPYDRVGVHSVVIGDDYVFSSYEAKLGAARDGIYVDGHTGQVAIKQSIEVVRP